MVSGKSGGATTPSNISAFNWLIVTDAFNQSVFERNGNYMKCTAF
jgi:hypothetical protein